MTVRRCAVVSFAALVWLAAPVSAANYRTPNFVVTAPDERSAQTFGQYAEHYRREKAIQWLGREMPQWPQPCPLKVTVQMSGAGGATEFDFDPQRGGVAAQRMRIEGSYERLLHSVLPHEVTHTVFAQHFGRPVPRWADEGGSVLSEDAQERNRHDGLCRSVLNQGRAMKLRTLFNLRDYPPDVMMLYAEGYSITSFLVDQRDRATFLAFIGYAIQSTRNNPNGPVGDWDGAARQYYGVKSLDELEEAWLNHLRNPKNAGDKAETSAAAAPSATRGELTNRVATRDTSLPLMTFDAPVVRGQSPGGTEAGRFRDMVQSRPGYLPEPARPAPPMLQLRPPEWRP